MKKYIKLNQKTKDILSFIGRIAFSLILLLYIFSKIDVEKTVEVIKSADLIFIFYAALTFILINFLLLLRWFIYIKALELAVITSDVIRYFFIGLFGNLFLPSAIGGDLIKIIGLCKNNPTKAKVVASVLLDRLSGFAAIALVGVGAFLFGYKHFDDYSILVLICAMAAGSIFVAGILFNEKVYSFGCKIFNKLPKVKSNIMNLHYDVMLLRNKKKEGVKAVILSCLCQIIFSFTFFLIAKSLHQEINIVYFLIFVPLICVASSFPSIGGLGVREAGTAYLFSKIGVDAGVAVSISLINFLFMVILGLFGGMIYVFTLSSGRIQRYSSDVDIDTAET